MKCLKLINKLAKEQDGSIIVIVALFMTILMIMAALVLDIGLAYSVKSELQKDLDSVALAAVRNLPASGIASQEWINAKSTALEYAQSNGITDLAPSDISPVYKDGKIVGLTVKGDADVVYGFARILGFNSAKVKKSSTAELMTVSGMSGLLPLALPKGVVDIIIAQHLEGQDLTLKLGPKKLDGVEDMRAEFAAEFDRLGQLVNAGLGWRGALDFILGGTNGAYKTALANGGYDGMVNIGDSVDLNSGTMPVDVKDNILIGDEVVLPVVDYDAERDKLVVVGFATFKITNLEGNNPNAKKVSILTSSYISSNVVSGSNSSTGGIVLNDYGVKAAKLTN